LARSLRLENIHSTLFFFFILLSSADFNSIFPFFKKNIFSRSRMLTPVPQKKFIEFVSSFWTSWNWMRKIQRYPINRNGSKVFDKLYISRRMTMEQNGVNEKIGRALLKLLLPVKAWFCARVYVYYSYRRYIW
jgi:hypothetical protein